MDYETVKYEDGSKHKVYKEIAKLSNNQTIKIEFYEEDYNDKVYYSINLIILNKKKRENQLFLKSTGKNGLEGLIWAKKQIISFENFIKEEWEARQSKPKNIIIIIGWDDNRRRNVYEYGLKKLGYSFNFMYGKKVLSKNIKIKIKEN